MAIAVVGLVAAKHRPARSQPGSGVAGGPQRGQYQRRARAARPPRLNLLRRGHAGEAHQVPEEIPAQGEQQIGNKFSPVRISFGPKQKLNLYMKKYTQSRS
jgi:hypothetical protein